MCNDIIASKYYQSRAVPTPFDIIINRRVERCFTYNGVSGKVQLPNFKGLSFTWKNEWIHKLEEKHLIFWRFITGLTHEILHKWLAEEIDLETSTMLETIDKFPSPNQSHNWEHIISDLDNNWLKYAKEKGILNLFHILPRIPNCINLPETTEDCIYFAYRKVIARLDQNRVLGLAHKLFHRYLCPHIFIR